MKFLDEAVLDSIELAKKWKIKGCTFWLLYEKCFPTIDMRKNIIVGQILFRAVKSLIQEPGDRQPNASQSKCHRFHRPSNQLFLLLPHFAHQNMWKFEWMPSFALPIALDTEHQCSFQGQKLSKMADRSRRHDIQSQRSHFSWKSQM